MSANPSTTGPVNEPGVDAASVRALIDGALVSIAAIEDEEVPVRDAEWAVSSALQCFYRAAAARTDPAALREAVTAGCNHLRAALGALQESPTMDPAVSAALAGLARALGGLSSPSLRWSGALGSGGAAAAPAAVAAAPVLALIDEPKLLEFPRDQIFPVVPLPEDLVNASGPPRLPAGPPDAPEVQALHARFPPPPRAFEARAEKAQLGVAIPEPDLLFMQARACFEDLAGLGNNRRPEPDALWYRPRTEERLLARVDAVLACGEWVLPRLIKMIEDRPAPDPQMVWAALFVCGSVAGPDMRDQMMRLVATAPLKLPPMRLRVADALALAPHPGIDEALRPLLRARESFRREVAVVVLGRRGALTIAEVLDACNDRSRPVARAAVRALGRTPGDVPPPVWRTLLASDDMEIAEAAMSAAILHRSELGARRAAELLMEGRAWFGEAALHAAVGLDERTGFGVMRASAEKQAAMKLMAAFGWFGHIEAVPWLIEQLGAGGAVAEAAVGALHRITGAGLTKDDPEPEYEHGDLPFVRAPARPLPVVGLLPEPGPWDAWWRKYRGEARAGTRYRHGHVWAPEDNLWDMEDPLSDTITRRFCYLELVARTGVTLPFDPLHFVARQQRQIAALRGAVASAGGSASGNWPTRYRH
jgi:hypothetical protein